MVEDDAVGEGADGDSVGGSGMRCDEGEGDSSDGVVAEDVEFPFLASSFGRKVDRSA